MLSLLRGLEVILASHIHEFFHAKGADRSAGFHTSLQIKLREWLFPCVRSYACLYYLRELLRVRAIVRSYE